MSAKTRKKVLFVVYSFIQAGGERYTYEIAQALNKDRYDVHFLKIYPLLFNKDWDTEYYYKPLLDAGFPIFFWEDILSNDKTYSTLQLTYKYFSKVLPSRVNAKLYHLIENRKQELMNSFFSNYAIVNWMGIGIYTLLGLRLPSGSYTSYIHVLTTKFQYENDCYEKWDKNKHYHFVTPFSHKLLLKEMEDFKSYDSTYFPMSLTLTPFTVDASTKPSSIKTIAVFTRIDKMKPMEPYIYGLKLLREKGMDVQLFVYGAGNPQQTGLKRQISHLYLDDFVHFKGHTASIENTLKHDDLDLVWFQSGNNRPAGFAAFEIAMSGIPQVFWDFGNYEEDPEYNNIYPNFIHLNNFVNLTFDLLEAPASAFELGQKQQQFVLLNQDIKKNINIIEKLFDANTNS